MSSPLIKSPLEMLYEQAGIPHMQAGGQPPQNPYPTTTTQQQALQQIGMQSGLGYKPDLRGYTPPDFIPAYRPDIKGKYGGKQGLETQPTYFDKMQMQEYVKHSNGKGVEGQRGRGRGEARQ
jgi:hypothetical protein